MPHDGVHVSSADTGHARLHEPQDHERAGREPEHPVDVKFKRVWTEYSGSSGTQRLRGR